VQQTFALLMIGIFLGACAKENESPAPDAAHDTPDATAGEPSWPPKECAGLATPYTSESCLAKIRDVCRSHQDKQGCVSQGKVDAAGGFIVFCNWVPVVTFTDDVSCIVESSRWRCEGHLDLLDPCSDPCEVNPELYYAWKAIPSEREMIKMCSVPIGPWLFGGMGPMYGASCLPGRQVEPPNPPLCDCIPQACEVTRGLMADQF
jgi:hypothetical protein